MNTTILRRSWPWMVVATAWLAVATLCWHLNPAICQIDLVRYGAQIRDLHLLGHAVDQFKLKTGRYPSIQENFQVLDLSEYKAAHRTSNQPANDPPSNPWGHVYQYQQPGVNNSSGFDLWSYGRDGIAGGKGMDADVEQSGLGFLGTAHKRLLAQISFVEALVAGLVGGLIGLALSYPLSAGLDGWLSAFEPHKTSGIRTFNRRMRWLISLYGTALWMWALNGIALTTY